MRRPCTLWTARLALTAALLVLPSAALAQDTTIKIANTAKYIGSGRYDWRVYVDASAARLARIDSVEYTLHPTFVNPVRRVRSRANKFALASNGWGEFEIRVRVFERRKVTETKHWLSFAEPSTMTKAAATTRPAVTPPSRPSANGKVTTGNTSSYMGDDRWNWNIFIAADSVTLLQVECVEYTLDPTFPNPVRTVCTRGAESGRGFALSSNGWGTFTIGVKVTFRNRETRQLKHELQFSAR